MVGMQPHLRSGPIEAIFTWLPHGPRERKKRILEFGIILPLLLLGIALLGRSVLDNIMPGLGTAVRMAVIAAAGIMALLYWLYGIILLVSWVSKTKTSLRLLKALAIFVVTLLYPPVLYLIASRLLAGVEGNAMTSKEEERMAINEAVRLLNFVGLKGLGNQLARNLPYGEQRRLEIARALANKPALLLLDEPTAGMNPQESADMMHFIRRLRDELSITILLIEHDMRVVMGISENINVLDFGVKIAEGTPEQIQKNTRVIEAYLGRGAASGLGDAATATAVS